MNPSSMPLDVSKSNSASSSSSSRCWSIIFVAISIITLILEIITFTQHWWPDLTPFAVKVGPNNYVNVSPSCSVSYMGRSQNIASDGNCVSYNVIKAFLLVAHFAGIACTILLLLCIFAPSCHLRLPIRTMAVSVAITMIVSFICNLIAMFVFIANEQRDQRKLPSYYYNYRFSWHAGFILFIVVVVFQGVLCLLLIPTVRSLMRMKQINQNMPQLQQQALNAPQLQYQPYQQPPQYPPQYQPLQPFMNPAPASAPLPSVDAGVFVPIPGSNAYLYYPPGQSLAEAQQHVQAIQTQMQTNAPQM